MNRILLLLLGLMLAACAHQAKHFNAPDSTALTAAAGRLDRAVTASRAQASVVTNGLAKAKAQHDKETASVAALEPQLAELARVAPPELMPQIHGLTSDVDDLKADQADTATTMTTLAGDQAKLTQQLDEATAAKADVAKLSPAYFAQVDQLTVRANTAEAGWAKDSAEIVQLRTQSIVAKILGGLAVLAVGALAFLWFTGRLALKGAAIAAKLP